MEGRLTVVPFVKHDGWLLGYCTCRVRHSDTAVLAFPSPTHQESLSIRQVIQPESAWPPHQPNSRAAASTHRESIIFRTSWVLYLLVICCGKHIPNIEKPLFDLVIVSHACAPRQLLAPRHPRSCPVATAALPQHLPGQHESQSQQWRLHPTITRTQSPLTAICSPKRRRSLPQHPFSMLFFEPSRTILYVLPLTFLVDAPVHADGNGLVAYHHMC
jgi:hypothetical protein